MGKSKDRSGVYETIGMAERKIIWPFWLELAFTTVIPFAIWWGVTPTNILNSSFLWGLLEIIGLAGSAIIVVAGVPAGIIGIRTARKMDKMRIASKVLSIINLCAGIFEIGLLLLIFVAVIFGGASV